MALAGMFIGLMIRNMVTGQLPLEIGIGIGIGIDFDSDTEKSKFQR